MRGASLVREARVFAAERHRGQLRKGDGKPFITHPTAVAAILARHRMPPEVVAAGFLHDVLEDTPTPAAEIRRLFGPKVEKLVRDVTEPDKRHPWEFRKRAYLAHMRHASRGALAISCADKLHNTLSLIAAYRREGPAVFDRFSRGMEEKLAYHLQICREIRRRWSACPMLGKLERAVAELGRIVARHQRSLPREVEAKFLVRSPAVLRVLEGLKELGGFRRKGLRREQQVNTYWDTEGLRILHGRAALKARQVGARCEITFKREIGYRGGVSERIEITERVPLRDLPRVLEGERACEPVHWARKIIGRFRPLREVLKLATDRRVAVFGKGKERIEMDIDRVTVLRGERSAGRYAEVEMENTGASPARYAAALADLQRRFRGSLRLSRLPKYEIGLAMLRSGTGSRVNARGMR